MENFDLEGLTNIVYYASEPRKEVPELRAAAQTGILSLDLALGGGFAPGITEIYGPPSSGKTALLGQTIAHNQRRKGLAVAIVPAETLDTAYLAALGVDLQALLVLSLSDVVDFLETFDEALLVIDPLTALMDDCDGVGTSLFDMTWELSAALRPKQCVVVTSHVRTQTSVAPGHAYRSGVRSASKRLADMFCTRLELERTEVSPPRYVQVVKILANVLGPPSQFVRLHSTMGRGVDRFRDLVEIAEGSGALERRGNYYYLDDLRLGPGVETAARQLAVSEELETAVVRRVLEVLED